MYEFIDRDVDGLDRGTRFLLSAMRSWVAAVPGGQCPCLGIGPSFSRNGLTAALTPFHVSMTIFNRDALEIMRFGSAHCTRVHEHEALILSLVSALRAGRPERARATMSFFIREEAVPNLLCSLYALARLMARAALFPQLPDRK